VKKRKGQTGIESPTNKVKPKGDTEWIRIARESELEKRASKRLKSCEPRELVQSPREYQGGSIRERSLIGEKIGLSESEGFSGLCFGERIDVA
jgi:hypothetical protein